MCPSVENPNLVLHEAGYIFQTYSRPAECGSRQTIGQARPDHSNRVDSPPRGLPFSMQQVVPNLDRPFATRFNNKLTQFVSPVPDPLAWAVDAHRMSWEDPRASAFMEQGFFKAVAARIEAPQRGSTRSVYEAKWTIFTKWCLSNQGDFRSPPIKSIADFLLYLFQDRKLQPSTIDGSRSASSYCNSGPNIG